MRRLPLPDEATYVERPEEAVRLHLSGSSDSPSPRTTYVVKEPPREYIATAAFGSKAPSLSEKIPEFKSEEEELEYWKGFGLTEGQAQEVMKARGQGLKASTPAEVVQNWGSYQQLIWQRAELAAWRKVEEETGGWFTAEPRGKWWEVEQELRKIPGGEGVIMKLRSEAGSSDAYYELLSRFNVEKFRAEVEKASTVVEKGGEYGGKYYLPGGLEVPKEVYELWRRGQSVQQQGGEVYLPGTTAVVRIPSQPQPSSSLETLAQTTNIPVGVAVQRLRGIAETPAHTTFLEGFGKGLSETLTMGVVSAPAPHWERVMQAEREVAAFTTPRAPSPTSVQLPIPAEVREVSEKLGPASLAGAVGYAAGTAAGMVTPELAAKAAQHLPGGTVKIGDVALKFENLSQRIMFEARMHLPERLGRGLGDVLVETPNGWVKVGEQPLPAGTYTARIGRLVPHIPTEVDVFAQRAKVPEGEAGRIYVGYAKWEPAPEGLKLDLLKLKPGEVGYIPTKEGVRVPVTEGKWGFFGVKGEEEAFRAQWLFGVGGESGSAFKWGFVEKPLKVSPPKIETTAVRLTVDVEKVTKAAEMGGGLPARSVLQIASEGAPLSFAGGRPAVPVKPMPAPALNPPAAIPPLSPALKPALPASMAPELGRREERQLLIQPRIPQIATPPLERLPEKPEVRIPTAEKPLFRDRFDTAVAPRASATYVVTPRVASVPAFREAQRVGEAPRLAPRVAAPAVPRIPAATVPRVPAPSLPAPKLPPLKLPSLPPAQIPALRRGWRWGKWWHVRWF